MRADPQNKILPFKHPSPLPRRWMCPPPCSSTIFTLWDDGKVYCAHCMGHHSKVAITVDESESVPAA